MKEVENGPQQDPSVSLGAALFAQTLSRSTSTIKSDRATEIAELAEISFKRCVEDLERDLKIVRRKKKSSIDLSPDNTYSIMKVKDFEPEEFQRTYNEIGLKERELVIKLNNAKNSYNELFGTTFTLETIV
jgi:hypothetical protein